MPVIQRNQKDVQERELLKGKLAPGLEGRDLLKFFTDFASRVNELRAEAGGQITKEVREKLVASGVDPKLKFAVDHFNEKRETPTDEQLLEHGNPAPEDVKLGDERFSVMAEPEAPGAGDSPEELAEFAEEVQREAEHLQDAAPELHEEETPSGVLPPEPDAPKPEGPKVTYGEFEPEMAEFIRQKRTQFEDAYRPDDDLPIFKTDPLQLAKIFGIGREDEHQDIRTLKQDHIGYRMMVKVLELTCEHIKECESLFPPYPSAAQVLQLGLKYLHSLHAEPDRLDYFEYIGFVGGMFAQMGYNWERSSFLLTGKDPEESRHAIVGTMLAEAIIEKAFNGVIEDLRKEGKQASGTEELLLESAKVAIMHSVFYHQNYDIENPAHKSKTPMEQRVKEMMVMMRGPEELIQRGLLQKGLGLEGIPKDIYGWRREYFDPDHTEPNYVFVGKLEATIRNAAKVMKTSNSPALVQMAKERMKEGFMELLIVSIGHQIGERVHFFKELQALGVKAESSGMTRREFVRGLDQMKLIPWLNANKARLQGNQNFPGQQRYTQVFESIRGYLDPAKANQPISRDEIAKFADQEIFKPYSAWDEEKGLNVDGQNVLFSCLVTPEWIFSRGAFLKGERVGGPNGELSFADWQKSGALKSVFGIGATKEEQKNFPKPLIPLSEVYDGFRPMFEEAYARFQALEHPRFRWQSQGALNRPLAYDEIAQLTLLGYQGALGLGMHNTTDLETAPDSAKMGFGRAGERIHQYVSNYDERLDPNPQERMDPGNFAYYLAYAQLNSLSELKKMINESMKIVESQTGFYGNFMQQIVETYYELYSRRQDGSEPRTEETFKQKAAFVMSCIAEQEEYILALSRRKDL